jgi:hypothetical protein
MEYISMEDEALFKMEAILEEYGLQITLKILADGLENLMYKRGKSITGLLVLESIKGLHAGYVRRNEIEDV